MRVDAVTSATPARARRRCDRARGALTTLATLALTLALARGASSVDEDASRASGVLAESTRLRADFELEDSARVIDVVSYEGPAYDGCCPLRSSSDGVAGELLACCTAGGCCPNTEPGGGFGKHLACCENRAGSEASNRARSRVWYSGPSYDGCCPTADGENLACCASGGCCPTDGSERRACCPRLAAAEEMRVVIDPDERESRDAEASYYDDAGEDGRHADEESTARRRRSARSRAGESDASAYDETMIGDVEDATSTVYLQLAAGLCVVVWAAALAAGMFYQRSNGRQDEENAQLVDPRARARRRDDGFGA